MIKKTLSVASALAILVSSTAAFAGDYDAKAKALADTTIKAWLNNPVVINAVKASNDKHASLTQADIDALDKQWRADDADLINGVMDNELSTYLKGIEADGAGMYTEIFVMDNKGLNVGQSVKTSDYWQGDEAKWQETYLKGADSIHLSDVEEDESSQTFQMQISLPVVDGSDVIGAVTVGVNAENLE